MHKRFAIAAGAAIVALSIVLPVAASAKIRSVEVVNDSDYCISVRLNGRTADLRTVADTHFSLQAHKHKTVDYSEAGAHLFISGAREQPAGCNGVIPKQRAEETSTIDRTVYVYAWHATYTFREPSAATWTLTKTP